MESYPRVEIKLSADTLCKGDTIIAVATPGYYRYDWGSGLKDSSIAVVTIGGKYYLKVFSEFGCSEELDSFEVFDLPNPSVSFTHLIKDKNFSAVNTSNKRGHAIKI
jgi:hypothetical protein